MVALVGVAKPAEPVELAGSVVREDVAEQTRGHLRARREAVAEVRLVVLLHQMPPLKSRTVTPEPRMRIAQARLSGASSCGAPLV